MPEAHVRRLTRVGLVLEVLLPPAGAPLDFLQIVESIPNREGTVTRTWSFSGGRLDEPTWLDIQNWLVMRTSQLLESLGGAQLTLG